MSPSGRRISIKFLYILFTITAFLFRGNFFCTSFKIINISFKLNLDKSKFCITPLQPCLLSKLSSPFTRASSALTCIKGFNVVLTE